MSPFPFDLRQARKNPHPDPLPVGEGEERLLWERAAQASSLREKRIQMRRTDIRFIRMERTL